MTSNRVFVNLGAAILLAMGGPMAAEGQQPFQLRIGASGSALQGYDYSNLEIGGSWSLDLLFPGNSARLGLGIEYAEYPITDEEERLVMGAADLILISGSSMYLELRGGVELQGWDEPGVRYVTQGMRGGGGIGVQIPLAGLALDLAVFGNYFLGLTALANGDEVLYTESGPRYGLRATLLLPRRSR